MVGKRKIEERAGDAGMVVKMKSTKTGYYFDY